MTSKPRFPPRGFAPGQSCRVYVVDTASGEETLVHESADVLLEAPNWSADGDSLLLNGAGLMWRLELDTGELREIPFEGLPDVNNDHVLSPDGARLYLSAMDFHIYVGSVDGGQVERLTVEREPFRMHFLHGVSPDESTLAYIGLEEDADGARTANVFTRVLGAEDDTQLTFGSRPADGSEYSPDGEWIYFNTEQFTTEPGHAQLARMRVDGSGMQQLTFDERVNWFPHLSPDGTRTAYVSYEAGTVGHPADRPVEVRLVVGDDYASPRTLARLNGGQGTINVNSWAPDSRRLAYVAYTELEEKRP